MWSVGDLCNNGALTLKLTDTVAVAKELILSEGVNHLPVIENGLIKCLVSMEDLELLDEGLSLSSITDFHLENNIAVQENMHYFEALQNISNHPNLLSLPVIDEENKYKGIIKLKDVLKHYIPQNAAYNEASWVVLVMPAYEYSLTRIADIVEYNRCKVLQVLTKLDEENQIWVQLLINSKTVSSSIKSFERFGFRIAYVNSPGEAEDNDVRYQSLMKYLDL